MNIDENYGGDDKKDCEYDEEQDHDDDDDDDDDAFYTEFKSLVYIEYSMRKKWNELLNNIRQKFRATQECNLDRFLVERVLETRFPSLVQDFRIVRITGCSQGQTLEIKELTLLQFGILQLLRYFHYRLCLQKRLQYESGLVVVDVMKLPFQRLYFDVDVNEDAVAAAGRDDVVATTTSTTTTMDLISERAIIIHFFSKLVSRLFPCVDSDKRLIITSRMDKPSFHIYCNLHVDFITRQYIYFTFLQLFKTKIQFYTLDNPANISLSCTRGHFPRYLIPIVRVCDGGGGSQQQGDNNDSAMLRDAVVASSTIISLDKFAVVSERHRRRKQLPITLDDWMVMAPLDIFHFNCYGLRSNNPCSSGGGGGVNGGGPATLSSSSNRIGDNEYWELPSCTLVNPVAVKLHYSETDNIAIPKEEVVLTYDSKLFKCADDAYLLETARRSNTEELDGGGAMNKLLLLAERNASICDTTSPLLKLRQLSSLHDGFLQCTDISNIKYDIRVLCEFIRRYSIYEIKRNLGGAAISNEAIVIADNFVPQELYEHARLFDITNARLLGNEEDGLFIHRLQERQEVDLRQILTQDPLNPDYLNAEAILHFSDYTVFPFTDYQLQILDIIEEIPHYRQRHLDIFFSRIFDALFVDNGESYAWSLYILCIELDIICPTDYIFSETDQICMLGDTYEPPDKKGKKMSTTGQFHYKKVFKNSGTLFKIQVAKRIMETVINSGSVTSTVKFLRGLNIFAGFVHCVAFAIKHLRVSLHAKFILSYYLQLPSVPTTFFTDAFYNDDIMSTLFYVYCDKVDNEGIKNLQHVHREFSVNGEIFFALFAKYSNHIEINEVQVFLKDICGLQSIKNGAYVIYSGGIYVDIDETTIKRDSRLRTYFSSRSGMEDNYHEKYTEFSFFINHAGVGLFNSPLNVYELSGSSFKTLVSYKKVADLDSSLLTNTYYPKFQNTIFLAYQKMFHFLKKCHEDSLNVMLLAPLFPIALARDYQRLYNPDFVLLETKIDYFIVTLADLIKMPIILGAQHNVALNRRLWNEKLLETLIAAGSRGVVASVDATTAAASDDDRSNNYDDCNKVTVDCSDNNPTSSSSSAAAAATDLNAYSDLIELMKFLFVIFGYLSDGYNINFYNFSDIVQNLFHKNWHSYLGLPADTRVDHASMSFCNESGGGGASLSTGNANADNIGGGGDDSAVIAGEREWSVSGGCFPASVSDPAHIFSAADDIKSTLFFHHLREKILSTRTINDVDAMADTADNLMAQLLQEDENVAENTTTTTIATWRGGDTSTTTGRREIICLSDESLANMNISPVVSHHTSALGRTQFLIALTSLDDALLPKYASKINLGSQQNIAVIQFLLLFLSWIVRMGGEHMYQRTFLFRHINTRKNKIYAQLIELIKNTSGPLIRCTNLDELTNVLEMYVHQTTSSSTFDFEQYPSKTITFRRADANVHQTLQRYDTLHSATTNATISQRMMAMDTEMCRKYTRAILRTLSLLILFSELNFDTVEDLLKFIISLQFRGNMHRSCTVFYGVTSSLKTQMLTRITQIHESISNHQIPNVNISKMKSQDFDASAFVLASNGIATVDEVNKINPTRVKQMANLGCITNRAIHGNAVTQYFINAKLALTSNCELSADQPTLNRLKLIEKVCQFCSTNRVDDDNLNRLLLRDPSKNDSTSSILGASLLMQRFMNWMPASIEITGLKLLQQFLLPLFFYESYTPISNNNSETMLLTHRKYVVRNYPAFNFISRVRIAPSEDIVSYDFFIEILTRWWSQNHSRFNITDYKEQNFITDVCNYLEYFKQPCGGYKFVIEKISET